MLKVFHKVNEETRKDLFNQGKVIPQIVCTEFQSPFPQLVVEKMCLSGDEACLNLSGERHQNHVPLHGSRVKVASEYEDERWFKFFVVVKEGYSLLQSQNPYATMDEVIEAIKGETLTADQVAHNTAQQSAYEAAKQAAIVKRAAEVEAQKAKAEAKVKGVQILKSWSIENGSDLLKARIQDNYEWQGKAEIEFANSIKNVLIEEGFNEATELSPDFDVETRTTPTLREIFACRRINALSDRFPVKATLQWVTYYLPDDEWETDDEGNSISKESRCEVQIQVTCPNDNYRKFFLLPK